MAYINQEKKKELAPRIKEVAKTYGYKVSLSINNHSTLVATISDGPASLSDIVYSVYMEQEHRDNVIKRGYFSINHHHLDKYVGEVGNFLRHLYRAMSIGNHNNSDYMTDYFDIGWYVDISFGKWNKAYKNQYGGDEAHMTDEPRTAIYV